MSNENEIVNNTISYLEEAIVALKTGDIGLGDLFIGIAQNELDLLFSAQQSAQRTAIAASQHASFITDGDLPSKARGATRRRLLVKG